ncbi:unnamed protein product, partial [Hymenolepis diminuta]
FPELLFIRILCDISSVFRPRGRSDVFYVRPTHNSCLSCLNEPVDFPPFFFNCLASPKSTPSLLFSLVLIHVTHTKPSFVSHTTHLLSSLPRSPLNLSLSLSLSLSHISNWLWLSLLNFWPIQSLVLCFTIVLGYYSNSYYLVTVSAVAICYL